MKDVPDLNLLKSLLCFLMLNQMYEDVPSSIMLDKSILNELVNENVISLTQFKILKGQFLMIIKKIADCP